jgi:hypothetical protein
MRTAAGVLAVLGLAAASLPASADNRFISRTIPIVDLNNPCTRGHDSIDGTLAVEATLLRNVGDIDILRIVARGTGEDANNVAYRFLSVSTFQFHDPLPVNIFLSIRLTPENTAVTNARLLLALQVDERGRITDLGQSGLQCGGPV